MKYISSRFLTYMVNAGAIPNEKKFLDFYRYGFEITISTILNFLLVLIIGAVTFHFIESIVFLITFILLRMCTGGYHASTYFRCNLLMCCSFLSLILIYDFISSKFDFTFIIILSQMLFFSVAITCCPIEHINKPLKSEAKRKKMKFMSIAVGFIFSTIGLILICTNNNIGVVILLTQILVSILIIVAKIKKGGASHEKKE